MRKLRGAEERSGTVFRKDPLESKKTTLSQVGIRNRPGHSSVWHLGEYIIMDISFPTYKQSKLQWNQEYSNGKWDCLKKYWECQRYSIVSQMIYDLENVQSVLDLGCGEGILAQFLKENLIYRGFDISEKAVSKSLSGKNHKITLGNIDDISYIIEILLAENTPSFDVIILNEVFYHIENRAALLNAIKNLLSPNGRIIVSMHISNVTVPLWHEINSKFISIDACRFGNEQAGFEWICRSYKKSQVTVLNSCHKILYRSSIAQNLDNNFMFKGIILGSEMNMPALLHIYVNGKQYSLIEINDGSYIGNNAENNCSIYEFEIQLSSNTYNSLTLTLLLVDIFGNTTLKNDKFYAFDLKKKIFFLAFKLFKKNIQPLFSLISFSKFSNTPITPLLKENIPVKSKRGLHSKIKSIIFDIIRFYSQKHDAILCACSFNKIFSKEKYSILENNIEFIDINKIHLLSSNKNQNSFDAIIIAGRNIIKDNIAVIISKLLNKNGTLLFCFEIDEVDIHFLNIIESEFLCYNSLWLRTQQCTSRSLCNCYKKRLEKRKSPSWNLDFINGLIPCKLLKVFEQELFRFEGWFFPSNKKVPYKLIAELIFDNTTVSLQCDMADRIDISQESGVTGTSIGFILNVMPEIIIDIERLKIKLISIDEWGHTEDALIYKAKVVNQRIHLDQMLEEKNNLCQKNAQNRLNYLRKKPLISILLPCYESPESFLEDLLISIKFQTYSNYELCIVDDASSINILDIVNGIFKDDGRLKFKRRTQRGHISVSTNNALDMATGEYVVFVDHDDLLNENALLILVEFLNGCGYSDVIYSDESTIDMNGDIVFTDMKTDWLPESFLSHMYTGHLCAFRRLFLCELGGVRKGFEGSQDYDLMLRAYRANGTIKHIPEVLYYWRMSDTSTSNYSSVKPYADASAMKALNEHLMEEGIRGIIEKGPYDFTYQIHFDDHSKNAGVIILNVNNDYYLENTIEKLGKVFEDIKIYVHNVKFSTTSNWKNVFYILDLKEIQHEYVLLVDPEITFDLKVKKLFGPLQFNNIAAVGNDRDISKMSLSFERLKYWEPLMHNAPLIPQNIATKLSLLQRYLAETNLIKIDIKYFLTWLKATSYRTVKF